MVRGIKLAVGCVGSSDNVTYPTLNDDTSYCFEYTWLGPEYDNTTSYDGTCDDFRDESRLPDSVPCSSPLVISCKSIQTTPSI